MIFREWNGVYYHAVARILRKAVSRPVTRDELQRIVRETAFSESVLTILPSLAEGKWQLLLPDGTTPLRHPPTLPPSYLERQWLKAVSLDPRIRLFGLDASSLDDVEPLFLPDDIVVFDRCADGDPFEDESYIKTFRLLLDAIRRRCPLLIDVQNRRGQRTTKRVMPEFLEYSEKDDKFRLISSGSRHGSTINLGRILACHPCPPDPHGASARPVAKAADREIVMEVREERNAPERVLLHFAHFEKQAERLDETHYRVTVRYRQEDETELLIRVLSFGPMLRVIGPEAFVEKIRERLRSQKSCELL